MWLYTFLLFVYLPEDGDIAEIYRGDDVCGLLMILYNSFAFVGVYG